VLTPELSLILYDDSRPTASFSADDKRYKNQDSYYQ
jgi:hypothetical protein